MMKLLKGLKLKHVLVMALALATANVASANMPERGRPGGGFGHGGGFGGGWGHGGWGRGGGWGHEDNDHFKRGRRGRHHDRVMRLDIDMNHALYQGRDQRIYLKYLLQREYPRLNLNRFDLVRVRVLGKSAHGQGQAQLEINGRGVDRTGLPGTPREFNNNRVYYPVILENPLENDRGTWQIRLDGNIKIDKLVVVLETDRDGDIGEGPNRPGPQGPGPQRPGPQRPGPRGPRGPR